MILSFIILPVRYFLEEMFSESSLSESDFLILNTCWICFRPVYTRD